MSTLKGGLVVMTGYKSQQWSADIAIPFKQEASFWYLTGVREPDWWVVIEGVKAKTWLIGPEHNDHVALFDGQTSESTLKTQSGAYEILGREKGRDLLRQLARQHQLVYTVLPPTYYKHLGMELNPAQHELSQLLSRTFKNVQECTKQLSRQRAIKQSVELKAIEKAIKITTETYTELYEILSDFTFEYEIEAFLSQGFRSRGADGHAYAPIVANGANALTLHYGKNNTKLQKQKLTLIDAAAAVEGYAADITRTYSLSAPTKRQQEIHQALQSAQCRAIELCQPGMRVDTLQHEADRIMKETLLTLGMIKVSDDEDIWREYFPHAIGHGLGLDVHDSLAHETLQEGMVLTIEPGIYSHKDGTGMRIEDDILITNKGPKNLSRKLPTTW